MKTAILIAYDREDLVSEAVSLCEAAGYRVGRIMRQRFLGRPKYGIGPEALEDLERATGESGPDAVVVYDEILKPSQNYNLASKLHRNILDREALILEIFESRASSSESKLQVKLAQMRYEMSRAKERVRLAKMGEQPGFMGIGKFKVDVYYNDIKHRMHTVRSKLRKAGKQRELHRQARRRAGFGTVSLAGYTSAGKTTLFNKLTGESQDEGGELFTTLSTTTRRFQMGGQTYLLSDTVGFISKLPAYMIEAFKSTLEELLYTDATLLIVDIGDPVETIRKKFDSCRRTLGEIGVPPDRVILVLNKSDMASASEIKDKVAQLGLGDELRWVAVSALHGENLDGLGRLAGELVRARREPGPRRRIGENTP